MIPSTAFAAVWPSQTFSDDAVAVAAPATLLPVGVTGGGGGAITGPVPHARTSERPTLPVVALTDVSAIRSVVVLRAGKVTVVAAPALSSAGTLTVEPSEKVRVAPVAWSAMFGRSKSETALSCTGPAHDSCSQLPAPPPAVAHSAV